MKQQITYTLSYKEIEAIVREKLNERGLKIIGNVDFKTQDDKVLKTELIGTFTVEEEDLGENYLLLEKEKSADNLAREKLLATSINDLDISVRLCNCLRNFNLYTLGQIFNKYDKEGIQGFLKAPFGKKSLEELETLLREKKLIK